MNESTKRSILRAIVILCLSTPALATNSAAATAAEIPGIRTSEHKPSGQPVADILYIHGFADRLDNHGPLFKAWTDAGFRVLSFDLPSHGESKDTLQLYTFRRLAKLVHQIERATREDFHRPFFLAGWSTGALVAVRTVQAKTFASMAREVSGMILIAPGISVRLFVGEWGVVTERSLTSNANPPHVAGPKPVSPFLTPLFSTNLFFVQQLLAGMQAMPKEIPLLVFTADDKLDCYAVSKDVREWIGYQRERNLVSIVGFHCPGSRHEMDNEPGHIGPEVREASVIFSRAIVERRDPAKESYRLKACSGF